MCVATLNVTEDDIALGQSNPLKRVKNCAIYRAALRVIPNVSHVGPNRIMLTDGTEIILPPIARQFIRMADVQAQVIRGVLKHDPNNVDMEKLKPISFQIQYTRLE